MVPVEGYHAVFTHGCLAELHTAHCAEANEEAMAVALSDRSPCQEQLLVGRYSYGCLRGEADEIFPCEYSLVGLANIPHLHSVVH